MEGKQLSEFQNGQILVYNDSHLSIYNIAKKLNHHRSSIDVFLKNWKLLLNRSMWLQKKNDCIWSYKYCSSSKVAVDCNITTQK